MSTHSTGSTASNVDVDHTNATTRASASNLSAGHVDRVLSSNDAPKIMTTVAPSSKGTEKVEAIKFSDLCRLFEMIESCTEPQKKVKLLFNKEMKIALHGQSLYPLLRLVLPLHDSDRGKYGLKQAMVAKTYVDALNLAKTSESAIRLLHWKNPTKSRGIELSKVVHGDFARILEEVLTQRAQSQDSQSTIADVNSLLDELVYAISPAQKTAIIRSKVLPRFSAREQKWLCRLIFQDLKIGMGYEKVLGAFYEHALSRYNECSSLRLVCEEQGITSQLRGLQLMVRFSPMLAKGFPNSSTGQVNAVEEAMDNQPFIMDIKLDGERLCVHIDNSKLTNNNNNNSSSSGNNNKSINSISSSYSNSSVSVDDCVRMFTRRLTDYTQQYLPLGRIISASLSRGAAGADVRCILDGEVCAFDRDKQQHIAFGHNRSVGKAERIAAAELAAAAATSAVVAENGIEDIVAATASRVKYNKWRRDSKVRSYYSDSESDAGAADIDDDDDDDLDTTETVALDSSASSNRSNDGKDHSAVAADSATVATASAAATLGDEEEDKKGGEIESADHDMTAQLMYVAFDILYLDGPQSARLIAESLDECGITGRQTTTAAAATGELTNLPLIVRRRLLKKLLLPVPGRLQLVRSRVVSEVDPMLRRAELESFYNEVTIAGEEGLVVKNLRSSYELGEKSRYSGSWIKMKPEYGDQTEDLDVLAVGAYYGEGKGYRGSGINSFLCVIRDDSVPGRYYTLGKVAMGVTSVELGRLREHVATHSQRWDAQHPVNQPDFLSQHWKPKKKDDHPNLYLNPEVGIVLTVKCAELVESDAYSAGITMRFPRIQKVRWDKEFTDIMTLGQLRDIRSKPRSTTQATMQQTGGVRKKTAATTAIATDGDETATTATVVGRKRKAVGFVGDQFQVAESDVEVRGQIFEGKVFCLLGSDFELSPSEVRSAAVATATTDAATTDAATTALGDVAMLRQLTREKLTLLIREQCGEVVASATTADCVIVAGSNRTVQISNYIERGERDVIDFRYIVDCLRCQQLLPLSSCYFLGTSEATKLQHAGEIDLLGDSYTEEVTPQQLQRLLGLTHSTVAALQRKHSSSNSSNSSSRSGSSTATITSNAATNAIAIAGEVSAEAASILRDWERLSSSDWRTAVASSLTHEERDPVYCSAHTTLWQESVVVYFHYWSDDDYIKNNSNSNSRSVLQQAHNSLLDALRSLLLLHGAQISDDLTAAVTHIVLLPAAESFLFLPATTTATATTATASTTISSTTASALKQQLHKVHCRVRELRLLATASCEKRIVNGEWVYRCVREGRILQPQSTELIQFTTDVVAVAIADDNSVR